MDISREIERLKSLKETFKKEQRKERNEKLLSCIVQCPFCGCITNLYNIKSQHFKSKNCQEMKTLFFKSGDSESEHYYLLKIQDAMNETLKNIKPNDT